VNGVALRRSLVAVGVVSALLIIALAVMGCGGGTTTTTGATTETTAGGDTGTTVAPAETKTAVIGYTGSNTGSLNVESTRQTNGLNLWIEEVNGMGGLTLADGSKVMFETKSYDDESNKDRVQQLYTRLATDDKADFLISPYSSGLTDAASIIAEQNGRVMITTGAASDSTYQKGYSLVYQLYTPATRYLTGAIDMLMKTQPESKKVAFVYENDKFSTSVVEAARAYAKEKGLEEVLYEGYQSGTTDFGPFINKIQGVSPDAILGGGHFQDGSTLARQLKEKGIKVNYVALLVAPPEPTFSELGDAAIGIIGPSQWEPDAAYSAEAAAAEGVEYVGISNADFVAKYKAAYGEDPSYHSAGGYAAGLVLQTAIESAGSLDTAAVKAALDAMDVMTFYGSVKFDTTAESHGLQAAHSMVYVQWQKGGELKKAIVWPEAAATAEPIAYGG